MKILVTGATGFIGAAVARQLSQQHHEVLALSRSDAAAAKLRVAGLTPVAGDFAVPASLAGPLRKWTPLSAQPASDKSKAARMASPRTVTP